MNVSELWAHDIDFVDPAGDVVDLDVEHVAYRAEGNANLVLSLGNRGAVLRMRKSVVSAVATANDHIGCKEDAAALGRTVAYIVAISMLFEAPFRANPAPRLVRVHCGDWAAFNRQLLPLRPVDRHDKQLGECTTSVLYPDVGCLSADDVHLRRPALIDGQQLADGADVVVGGEQAAGRSTYAIEIKPKQGWWLPANQTADVDAAKCRFCSYQYLKVQQKRIAERSHYCPLDLFSGCRQQTERALRALIDNPQNNLRTFVDGVLLQPNPKASGVQIEDDKGRVVGQQNQFEAICSQLFGSKGNGDDAESNYRAFATLIAHALYSEFDTGSSQVQLASQSEPVTLSRTPGCNRELLPLPAKSVLSSVLRVQQLVASNLQSVVAAGAGDGDPMAAADSQYIDNIVRKMSGATDRRQAAAIVGELSAEEQYVLGATALDCSIMIAFRRISDAEVGRENGRHHVVWMHPPADTAEDEVSRAFAVKVTVIDLDPKQAHQHRRRYEKLTRDSQDAVRKELPQTAAVERF